MDNNNYKGKGIGMIVSAIIGAIVAWFMLSMSADAKEDWRYYWDEDYHNMMLILNYAGWGMVIGAVIDFVLGLVFLNKTEEVPAWNSNLITCPDCHKMVSRQAESCPHCGRRGVNQSIFGGSSSSAPATPAANQYIPTWKRIEMMEAAEKNQEPAKCAFCGETLIEGRNFCSACGRRRD
ncbi:MAG: hypothetical protein IJV82_03690 [Oscillospiraceae bacterium]|nr:hypothetical protein [Oscillospiraceae bacterium]